IVRACQDRRLISEEGEAAKLFERARSAPLLGTLAIEVSARVATTGDGRKRRQARQARSATVSVRTASVTFQPPYRPDGKLPAQTVTVVLAREESPAAGGEALQWAV